MRNYYVYILTNRSGTLYVGVTGDLEGRVSEHRQKAMEGFTKRYDIGRLVYYEVLGDINDAIAREKQIKGWLRKRRLR